MSYRTIIFTRKNRVGYITMSRPEAGNRINQQMAQELENVCSLINQDGEVCVAVLTGAGKSFCSGSEPESPLTSKFIASLNCPVIAAINGEALGQGLELALACDMRLASGRAKLGLPQIAECLMPMDGGTQRLPRIVGKGKALELILTGEVLSAQAALEIGLVSRVVAVGKLAAETEALAEAIASKSPIALRYVKETINSGLDLTLEQGLRFEADLYFLLHTTADRTEGIKAFLEKRQPRYKGQ